MPKRFEQGRIRYANERKGMKKISRLRKAWQRNEEFYWVKGVYFCLGPVKNWPTPKQLAKWLKTGKEW